MKCKKLTALFLACFMCLGLLAGCAKGSQNASGAIELDFLTWHGPDTPAKQYYIGYQKIIEEYMASHPNVKINIRSEFDNIYGTILETGFAGNTAPDIIQMKSSQRSTFSQNLVNLRTYLEEKSPYAQEGDRWVDSFIGGMDAFPSEDNGTDANALLFVPNDSNPEVYAGKVYMYNKALIKKAGLNPEMPPVTWTEMFQWLEALAVLEDIEPIAGSNDIGGKISQIGNLFGADFADEFFEEPVTNPAFASDLFYDKLYVLTCYEGGSAMPLDNLPYYPALFKLVKQHVGYFQKSWVENSIKSEILSFASGKTALVNTMFWDYTTMIGSVSEDAFPEGFGVFPLPYMGKDTLAYAVEKGWITKEEADAAQPYIVDKPSTHGATGRHEYGFTLNKQLQESPEKLAAAIDFLRYLSSKPVQEKYVETSKSISPVRGVPIVEELQNFIQKEPEGGFAQNILGIMVVEWGKSGWDIDIMAFLKGEKDWKTTVEEISPAEWVADIPSLEDLEAAVAGAQKDVDEASADTKESLERNLQYTQLRLELYRDYFYTKTGDFVFTA